MGNHGLVIETFKSAEEYVGRVRQVVGEIVGYFQTGKENVALTLLSALPEGIDWLIHVKELSEGIGKEYRLDIDCAALNNILKGLVEAQANKDYVLIADCLEYELLPVVEHYGKELARVLGELN